MLTGRRDRSALRLEPRRFIQQLLLIGISLIAAEEAQTQARARRGNAQRIFGQRVGRAAHKIAQKAWRARRRGARIGRDAREVGRRQRLVSHAGNAQRTSVRSSRTSCRAQRRRAIDSGNAGIGCRTAGSRIEKAQRIGPTTEIEATGRPGNSNVGADSGGISRACCRTERKKIERSTRARCRAAGSRARTSQAGYSFANPESAEHAADGFQVFGRGAPEIATNGAEITF